MFLKLVFGFVLAVTVPALNHCHAGFVLSVDPSTLTFNGAGAHDIGFLLTHDSTGPSDLSGYTVRLGTVADASGTDVPAGVTFNGATEGLAVSQGGPTFTFNGTNNQIAATNLGFGPFADVGSGGQATLFTVQTTLGSDASYDVGVDFRNAQRGGLFATDISDEFFAVNSLTTDFSFTLTNGAATAVPEPSSMILFGLASCGAAVSRFRKRSGKAKSDVQGTPCPAV